MRRHAILRVHRSTDPLVYWDALEGYNPSTAGRYGRAATIRLAAELGLPIVGNSDGHTLDTIGDGRTYFPGSTAEDYRRALVERTTSGGCVDWGFVREALIYGRQVRKQARDVARWGRRNCCGTTRRATWAYPRELALQRQLEAEYLSESRQGPPHGRVGGAARSGGAVCVKIGLVTPYVYPLPGGVNEHVRFLYENLRLRGHDVRILTSSHGLQRSSEGDVIRIGKGFSVPSNGSVGTITLSPRYVSQVQASPRPASSSTCSTSTSRSCRSCRSSCCASRRA